MKAQQQLLQHLTEHEYECDTKGDWFISRACENVFQCNKAGKLWFVCKSLLHGNAISSEKDENRLLQM
jgi:hypothetical protein